MVRAVLGCYLRLAVEGTAHVPAGAALLVANHPSALDPVLIAAALPRRAVFMGAAEFLTWPVVGWVMRAYGVVPVRRGRVDAAAVREAVRVLRAGGLLVIFPEGRVAPSGGALRPGAGLLAAAAHVPVVPVAVVGSSRALPLGRYLPRPVPVRVCIGPPLPPPPDREAGERTVEEAMAWIRRTAASRPAEASPAQPPAGSA